MRNNSDLLSYDHSIKGAAINIVAPFISVYVSLSVWLYTVITLLVISLLFS